MKDQLDKIALPEPSASVVDRLRYLIRLSRMTQARFAERVGIDPSNLSRMLSGHTAVSDAFINRVVVDLGVSKPWLTDGEGVPFPRDIHARSVNAGRGHLSSEERRGAPVYDINVSAGSANLSREFTDDRIVGYFDLPGVNPSNPLVRVRGNSMAPRLVDGSWVSIRPVSDTTPILWGQIYVVVLDDYRPRVCGSRHSARRLHPPVAQRFQEAQRCAPARACTRDKGSGRGVGHSIVLRS